MGEFDDEPFVRSVFFPVGTSDDISPSSGKRKAEHKRDSTKTSKGSTGTHYALPRLKPRNKTRSRIVEELSFSRGGNGVRSFLAKAPERAHDRGRNAMLDQYRKSADKMLNRSKYERGHRVGTKGEETEFSTQKKLILPPIRVDSRMLGANLAWDAHRAVTKTPMFMEQGKLANFSAIGPSPELQSPDGPASFVKIRQQKS